MCRGGPSRLSTPFYIEARIIIKPVMLNWNTTKRSELSFSHRVTSMPEHYLHTSIFMKIQLRGENQAYWRYVCILLKLLLGYHYKPRKQAKGCSRDFIAFRPQKKFSALYLFFNKSIHRMSENHHLYFWD